MSHMKIYNFGRRFSAVTIRQLEAMFPGAVIEEVEIRFDIDLQGNVYRQVATYVEDSIGLLPEGTKPVVALGGLAVGMAYLMAVLIARYGNPVVLETLKYDDLGGRYGLKGLYDSSNGAGWLSQS